MVAEHQEVREHYESEATRSAHGTLVVYQQINGLDAELTVTISSHSFSLSTVESMNQHDPLLLLKMIPRRHSKSGPSDNVFKLGLTRKKQRLQLLTLL